MSAKRPLNANVRKDQPRSQPRIRRKSYWKKALTLLLNCLALLLLLVSSSFVSQKLTPFPGLPNPVGDVATITTPGFDTCVAPPAPLLKTWWETSPYRWLNVYLGGASMFPKCGGEYLTPDWVGTVYEQGWSLLPTWVGPQAPCARQHVVMSNNATSSYAQGQAEADAAIKAASRLGFSNTAPIYFDMEYFNPTMKGGSRNSACIQAVNAFLHGWSDELTARNHLAGVYASASDYPLLDNSALTTSVVAWIAGGGSWSQTYDRTCTVYGNSYIPNNDWNTHQRIYQYTGGHNETYGQETWNIDSDCADAPMVGHTITTAVVLAPQTQSSSVTFEPQK